MPFLNEIKQSPNQENQGLRQLFRAFPLIEAGGLFAHTAQALGAGRYPRQSLTQKNHADEGCIFYAINIAYLSLLEDPSLRSG